MLPVILLVCLLTVLIRSLLEVAEIAADGGDTLIPAEEGEYAVPTMEPSATRPAWLSEDGAYDDVGPDYEKRDAEDGFYSDEFSPVDETAEDLAEKENS